MERIHEIVIVGSGFAGIGMAARLLSMGIRDFVVLEQSAALGGTWRDNCYPGAACDVESHVYSYSFEPRPTWSRAFAEQQEILSYLNDVTDKYGIRPHISFSSKLQSASWNEAQAFWKLRLEDGRSLGAKILVSGTGCLSRPTFPAIPGRETFEGPAVHTGAWDPAFDCRDKSVAVIGTGASAIQVVPSIALQVRALKLFQRTPPWILRKPDRRISPLEKNLFASLPFSQRLVRWLTHWRREFLLLFFVVKPEWMKLVQHSGTRYLEEVVKDPVLRAKLTPDYTPGCKRLLLSSEYYQAVQRDNVELVTDSIAEIRPRSIVTRDGREHAVDAIIFATGFETAGAKAIAFETRGRGGVDLADRWKDGAEAYLGTSVAGFPNLFFVLGPNTALGHNSVIYMIECQIEYIARCIELMRLRRLASVEVKQSVQDEYNRLLQERISRTVWASGCRSWYQSESGKNVALWPGFTAEYRKLTARFDTEDYRTRTSPSVCTADVAGSVRDGPIEMPMFRQVAYEAIGSAKS